MEILQLFRNWNVIILIMFLFGRVELVFAQEVPIPLPPVPTSNHDSSKQVENPSLAEKKPSSSNNQPSSGSTNLNNSKNQEIKSAINQEAPIKYSTKEFTPWNGNADIVSKKNTNNNINNNSENIDKAANALPKEVEKEIPKNSATLTNQNNQNNKTIAQDKINITNNELPAAIISSDSKSEEEISNNKTQTLKESEEFLKQEISTILKSDINLPYDIEPIYYDDQTLTNEQRKQLKNKVKYIVNNSEKTNFINKLLLLDYKVAKSYDTSMIDANKQDNKHIPESIDISSYKNIAFDLVVNGDLNGIRALINNKYISLNVRNKHGESLLIYSTLMGQADLVRLLLAKGANVNDVDLDGSTALHIAAARGNYEIAKALLAMGANSSIRNHLGDTPIDYAIKKGDSYLINLLS